MAKTNWQLDEIIMPSDMNQIGTEINELQDENNQSAVDYVRQPAFATTTGTASSYIVTLNPIPTNLVEGFGVVIKPHVNNADNPTININGLGSKPILKSNGSAITSGNLKANSIYTLRYNGSAFILQGEGGEGTVKSVQRGKINVTTPVVTVTINPVDLTKTVPKISFSAGTNDDRTQRFYTSAEITNSTTLTLRSGTALAHPNALVYWEIVEFNNVKSLQSGTIDMYYTEATQTINEVNMSKSVLFFSYTTPGMDAVEAYGPLLGGTIENSTTISFQQYLYSNSKTVKWYVVEFE